MKLSLQKKISLVATCLYCFFLTPLLAKVPCELAICAIFKDEAPYLKEWIEFHKLQGVEHFFLYNNNSSDSYLSVLEPYILSEEVTLTDWLYTYEAETSGQPYSWRAIQTGAYIHCVQNQGSAASWLAAIDIDEFLFCPNGQSLPSFLKNYTQYGGVCAKWRLFGTSHLATLPPNRLMIESLIRCAPIREPRNNFVKSIVQPKYVKTCESSHLFTYVDGYFAVNALEDKVDLKVDRCMDSYDYIRINHYWTRAEDHFAKRKIPSRNDRLVSDDEKALKKKAANHNDVTNKTILQFVPALREKMGYTQDSAH